VYANCHCAQGSWDTPAYPATVLLRHLLARNSKSIEDSNAKIGNRTNQVLSALSMHPARSYLQQHAPHIIGLHFCHVQCDTLLSTAFAALETMIE